MDETTYHSLADATLTHLADVLEHAYASGALDELERDASVLTIIPEGGRTLVVSKHAPTQQIWLASPRLGGLHFLRTGDDWKLPDGRSLAAILKSELAADGVTVDL